MVCALKNKKSCLPFPPCRYSKINKLKNKHIMHYDYYDDEYSGTYAHDIEGYTDEEIDNIFDGDPEAYWNID